MVGMKSGSGDDPFADEDVQNDDEPVGEDNVDADADEHQLAADDPFSESPTDETETDTPPTSTSRSQEEEPLPGIPEHPGDKQHRLPWIHRRDSVKDDRSHKTIHYTEHTLKRERRELIGAVENELGDDVELTDVREAAYLIGMKHPDEVANLLREWGYAIE